MARIRTIKPEFWTDEKIVECSIPARLLFIGLFNFADDNGCLVHSPKRIKMQVFPADTVDCEPLITELITHGLLMEYSVSDHRYLFIKGFSTHQKINRPSKTSIPLPPEFNESASKNDNKSADIQGELTESNVDTDNKFNDDSVSAHGGLTDGRERKGKELKDIDHGASAGADDLSQQARILESESGLNPEQLAVPESGLNPDRPTESVSGLTPEQVSEPAAGLNPERASGPVPPAEKINYQAILDVYHEVLPEMPRVKILTDDRKKHLRTFWKKYQFDDRKWRSYLGYIATHCRWMLTDRPNGRGGFWKCKNLDYLITERCYVAVKEERANDK